MGASFSRESAEAKIARMEAEREDFRGNPTLKDFFERTLASGIFEPPKWHPGSPKRTNLKGLHEEQTEHLFVVDQPYNPEALPIPGVVAEEGRSWTTVQPYQNSPASSQRSSPRSMPRSPARSPKNAERSPQNAQRASFQAASPRNSTSPRASASPRSGGGSPSQRRQISPGLDGRGPKSLKATNASNFMAQTSPSGGFNRSQSQSLGPLAGLPESRKRGEAEQQMAGRFLAQTLGGTSRASVLGQTNASSLMAKTSPGGFFNQTNASGFMAQTSGSGFFHRSGSLYADGESRATAQLLNGVHCPEATINSPMGTPEPISEAHLSGAVKSPLRKLARSVSDMNMQDRLDMAREELLIQAASPRHSAVLRRRPSAPQMYSWGEEVPSIAPPRGSMLA